LPAGRRRRGERCRTLFNSSFSENQALLIYAKKPPQIKENKKNAKTFEEYFHIKITFKERSYEIC